MIETTLKSADYYTQMNIVSITKIIPQFYNFGRNQMIKYPKLKLKIVELAMILIIIKLIQIFRGCQRQKVFKS